MVNLPRCIAQGGLQVLRFQIGEIGQDLLAALASGKERRDVLHTDPHTSDAGPAATLVGVVGDALAPTDQDRFHHQQLMDLDIVGPDALALPEAHEPLLSAIAAAAADTDRHGVQRRCFDAMAAAGLLGRPLQPPALQRELAERLFMADGSLTFCWLQHQLPLRRLLNAVSSPAAPAASALRDRWLEQVASGQALAGVAFAHLRRPGAANPAATRIAGLAPRWTARLDHLLGHRRSGAALPPLCRWGGSCRQPGAVRGGFQRLERSRCRHGLPRQPGGVRLHPLRHRRSTPGRQQPPRRPGPGAGRCPQPRLPTAAPPGLPSDRRQCR